MIDRRRFLSVPGALAAPALLMPWWGAGRAEAAEPSGVTVSTPSGRLIGLDLGGVHAFLGIPYALPPTGPRRFMPPVPMPAWRDARPARSFGPVAMQGAGGPDQSEDCLTLNVWAPAERGPHPVIVWIHGGSNIGGAPTAPATHGDRLARRGVVVVSVAYRVGVWGFLELGGLLGGGLAERYAGSGNNGLKDLLQALRWVRDHIAAFGGDPDCVTIAGHSAGAKNVSALLAMPAAQGLFHRAVSVSGGGQTSLEAATAQEVSERLLGQWLAQPGVGASHGRTADATRLLDAPAAELLSAQARMIAAWPHKFPFRAVVDGRLLPRAPQDAMAAGLTRRVPVLAGWAREDAAAFGPARHPDQSVDPQELAHMPADRFQEMQTRYRDAFPAWSSAYRRHRCLSMEEYGLPTLRLGEALSARGGPVFLYRYDLPRGEGAHPDFAVHGEELALLFDKLRDPGAAGGGPRGAGAERLSSAMATALVDFARHGTPDPRGTLGWRPYDTTARPVMRWDDPAKPVSDLDGAERRLWRDWRPIAS